MPNLPQDLQGLLIFLSASTFLLLGWFVKGVVRQVREVNATLANHFTEDAKALRELTAHMAAQTELARLLLKEVQGGDRERRRDSADASN